MSVLIKSYDKGLSQKKINEYDIDILVIPGEVVHNKNEETFKKTKSGEYFYPNKLSDEDIEEYSDNFELISKFLN